MRPQFVRGAEAAGSSVSALHPESPLNARALPASFLPRDRCQPLHPGLGGDVAGPLRVLQPAHASPARRAILAWLLPPEKERVTLISLSITNAEIILSAERSLIFKGTLTQK